MERADTCRTLAGGRVSGNLFCRVRGGVVKARMFQARLQEFMERTKSASGKNLFQVDWSSRALLEEAEQLDLFVVTRRVVAVTSLCRGNKVFLAIPEEHGFSQSGPRRQYDLICFRGRHTAVEKKQVAALEHGDAVPGSFQVVIKRHEREAQNLGERCAIKGPGQIGDPHLVVHHRPGRAECRGLRTSPAGPQKLADNQFETLIVAALKAALGRADELPLVALKQRQVAFRSADVAGENHAPSCN